MILHRIHVFILLLIYTDGIKSIKILQIKNGDNNFCTNIAGKSSSKSYENIMDLLNLTKPDLILYASNIYENSDVLYSRLKNNSVNIYKVYGTIDNSCVALKSCFQSRYINKNLLFIFVNTVLLQNNNSISHLKWITSQLNTVRKKKIMAIIVSYDSPGNLEFKNVTIDRKLSDIFMKFSKYIKGYIFYGELFDSIRIFLHNSNPVGSLGYAPHLNSISSIKASARLYDFNVLSQSLNVHNYKLTLKLNNQYIWIKQRPSILNNHLTRLYEFTQSLNKIVSTQNVSRNLQRYCKINNNWINNNCITNCTITKNACTILFRTNNEIQICMNNCHYDVLKNCNNLLLFSDIYFASNVNNNNNNSTSLSSIGNNGAIFVTAVIVGFVLILVGIVFAVNKVYCVRKTRQRSIFLSPLTIEVHVDSDNNNTNNIHQSSMESINRTIDTIKKIDEKPDTFNESNGSDNDNLKKSNGFNTDNHNTNHDYRRM